MPRQNKLSDEKPEVTPPIEDNEEAPIEFGMVIEAEPESGEPLTAAELGDLNPNVVLPAGGYAKNVRAEDQIAIPKSVELPAIGDHIELLRAYIGRRTKEQIIQPGIYAVDDPKLLGLANLLVQNGHARVING